MWAGTDELALGFCNMCRTTAMALVWFYRNYRGNSIWKGFSSVVVCMYVLSNSI